MSAVVQVLFTASEQNLVKLILGIDYSLPQIPHGLAISRLFPIEKHPISLQREFSDRCHLRILSWPQVDRSISEAKNTNDLRGFAHAQCLAGVLISIALSLLSSNSRRGFRVFSFYFLPWNACREGSHHDHWQRRKQPHEDHLSGSSQLLSLRRPILLWCKAAQSHITIETRPQH